MSDLPTDEEDAAEVDALYRRMAAAEPTQPGEGVRLAVLAYATRRAAQAASEAGVVPKEYSWQRRGRRWGRPAAFGALAAGILAAFMLGPRMFAPAPRTVPPVAQDRVAAAPPPFYADLNSSKLEAEPPAPAMLNVPVAPPTRAPGNAQRQPAPAAVADARTANVIGAAPAARASDASGAAGRLAAERAAGAPAESAATASATTAISNLAKSARPAEPAALWRAAANGDLATLRVLHDQQVDLNATDTEGRTALMLATLHGRTQAVSALLGYGADPNIVDASGQSPLAAALARNDGEIASALKAHGAR